MYDWMSSIMGAGMNALDTFNLDSINTQFPNINGEAMTGAISTMNNQILTVNHTFDLTNVPEGNSDSTIASMIIQGLDHQGVQSKLNKTLGKMKLSSKRSLGR